MSRRADPERICLLARVTYLGPQTDRGPSPDKTERAMAACALEA